MAEEDFLAEDGTLERGRGKANAAGKWADQLTDKFEELANHDSAFAQLRNAFDLTVAAALMVKEELWSVANVEAPQLASEYQLEAYDAPRSVATQATFLKKGRKWVITASGGVQVYPWQIADQTVQTTDLAPVYGQASEAANGNWWWQ